MGSNSDFIALTLRLDNDTYQRFHSMVVAKGATHNGMLRVLVSEWLDREEKLAMEKAKGKRATGLFRST